MQTDNDYKVLDFREEAGNKSYIVEAGADGERIEKSNATLRKPLTFLQYQAD